MNKLVVLFLLAGLLASCEFDSYQTVTYSVNEPVFISGEEFRNSVNVTSDARELKEYGKMCFYEGYLYLSEPGKGIHIINNENPSNPKLVGYIELMGNQDLAIRNGFLYADALIDLVWFDISNPSNPTLKGRVKNIFSRALPFIENEYGYDNELCSAGLKKGKIVIGWELKTKSYEVRSNGEDMAFDTSPAYSHSNSNGLTGSMSRFSLYENYLYAVIENQMSIINLSNEVPKKATEDIYIGSGVETIFSYQDKMFMGTPSGLIIYSVEDPLRPTYCSQIWHVYGCDPVVVENDLAYVTVHSGNFCGQNSNELLIIDVSDVYQPRQIVSYNMVNPKGLGIDNGMLFLCDDGLKIFKLTEPQTLFSNQLSHYKGMDGYDVIPYNNTLMMIADKGLYQYDYSDVNNIKELSFIPVNK